MMHTNAPTTLNRHTLLSSSLTSMTRLSSPLEDQKSVTRSDAQPHIIREWLNREDGQRTERDIIQFYSYLERAHHDLLTFAASANRPRILKDMLQHFIDH